MTDSGPPPEELLALAEEVATGPRRELRGAWPRATAVLTRRALESAVDELWRQQSREIAGQPARVSMRAKLLCLDVYVDGEVAKDVAYAWAALSRVCHHHPYELGPSGGELQNLLASVRTLIPSLAWQPPDHRTRARHWR